MKKMMKKEDQTHNNKTILNIIEADPIRRIIIVVISIIFISGAVYLRFHNLGKFGFWIDELWHVLAAKGLMDTGHPSLPGGVEYRRALTFTFLVYKSFQTFGINEMAARIPSVMFNILFILAGYFIIKNWYNKNSAIIFCIIMGFSPYILQITRESRMYTAFQLFYFLGTYLFWLGLERSKMIYSFEPFKKIEQKYNIDILCLVLALVIFCTSYHFHELTLTYPLVFLFYIVIVFFTNKILFSVTEIFKNKYGVVLTFIISIALLILFINPGYYVNIIHRATTMPDWKRGVVDDVKLYSWILRDESPTFFFLYPISVLFIIKKDFKKGLYIALSFLVPFAVHSFVFAWKEVRFMFYFYPFYIFSIAVLIEVIINAVWREMRQLKTKIKIINTLIPFCFVFSMFIFLFPWFFNSRHMTNYIFWTDWKPSLTNISTLLKKDSKVITLLDDRSVIYYYLKNPDYFIVPKVYDDDPDSYRKFNSKPVKNVRDLATIIENNSDVWVLAGKDEYFNKNRYFRSDMMKYISEKFYVLDSNENKDILVFRSK